jgi:hypothetical protein
MDTKHFHSSTSLPEGSKKQDSLQQEPNNSHQSPSQSSQTYTNVPSGTGASAQSATTLAEHVEPNQYQAVFAHQLVIFHFFFLPFFFKSDAVMLISSSPGR